jgi:OOP family OmpA-OmpF porin
MRRRFGLLGFVTLAVILAAGVSPAQAQFGKLKDKIKQKTSDKADQKVDQGIDAALEGAEKAITDSTGAKADSTTPGAPGAAGAAAAAPAGAAGGSAAAEDMALYTKYDFVPGDKVIFYDDLAGEEVGEFPSRWNLDHGVFEVARRGNRNFIMCTDEGVIFPRIAPGPLPPRYTVEMDFVAKGHDAREHWFYIEWVDADNEVIGELAMTDGHDTKLTILTKQLASKQLSAQLAPGIHTMRVMATKSTLKCYIDNERVANVPAVEGFEPVGLRVHMDPWTDEADNPMLMGGFRFAEGGKTLKDQLTEAGRIITHGILFDSGSARIKAESYKTLADIGQLLVDDPGLRLSIEGHTDSDGSDASNLTLSQQRAEAVRSWLVDTMKIDAGRLECKGWGESKPIDTNNTPEGKANNRRVELVKL